MYTFQDPASEYAQALIELHHHIMFLLFFIFGCVAWLLLRLVLCYIFLVIRKDSEYSGSFFSNFFVVYCDLVDAWVLKIETRFPWLLEFYVAGSDLKSEGHLSDLVFNPDSLFSVHAEFANIDYYINNEVGFIYDYVGREFMVVQALNFYMLHLTAPILSYLFFENVRHSTKLEIIWTLLPTFVLVVIALPSFALLYSYDEPLSNPIVTLKIIGHQWYWTVEYSDYLNGANIIFDSYMVHEDELRVGQLRLLEVDQRIILPVGVSIRVLITAADVLHSWALPAFAVKADAIPGRLNQIMMLITRPGVFYGQCSELCGVNHGFMPIVVEAVEMSAYLRWMQSVFV